MGVGVSVGMGIVGVWVRCGCGSGRVRVWVWEWEWEFIESIRVGARAGVEWSGCGVESSNRNSVIRLAPVMLFRPQPGHLGIGGIGCGDGAAGGGTAGSEG